MALTKTINNYETFIQEFRLEKSDDKPYLELFFKKKFVIVQDKKIIHPKIYNLDKKIKELEEHITNLKKNKGFWLTEKKHAENYYKNIKNTMFFKKKYWQHKLKQMVNAEYKEDIKNTKLTDEILMDPNNETLLNTFLVDYDYRKKLVDTVNKSIIYKDNNIGDHTKKKQILKSETANTKIEKLNEQIAGLETEIKSNKTLIRYIKQINKV